MRNKNFFWILTILLTVICLYQLSFTWYASNEEEKATKEAKANVKALKEEASKRNWELSIEVKDSTNEAGYEDTLSYRLKSDSTFSKLAPGNRIIFDNKAQGDYTFEFKNADSLTSQLTVRVGNTKDTFYITDLKELGAKAAVKLINQRNKGVLPNNAVVDFNQPGSEDIAKAAFVNQILKNRGEKPVYPVLDYSFSQVKKRSLAFGLDLVGGMSVTMEISIPDLIKSHAQNQYSLEFKDAYNKAMNNALYKKGNIDFLESFAVSNPKKMRVLLNGDGLKPNASDNEVVAYFRKLLESSMNGVEKIMYKRINQFGVSQPNIQKDQKTNRLYIELPGVQDEGTVAEKLKSTANLEFYETSGIESVRAEFNKAFGMTPQLAPGKGLKEAMELSTSGNPQEAAPYVAMVLAENKDYVDKSLKRPEIMQLFEGKSVRLMWAAEPKKLNPKAAKSKMAYELYACTIPQDGKARVNGKHVSNAEPGYDQRNGQITVDLSMTDKGSVEWGKMTTDNVNKIVAITMDNVVYSAPRVMNPITSGNTQISGTFTFDDAQSLSDLLNGGALPAPCVIKEQNKVGPSIGAENSKAGLISFGIAFVAVLLYMFFYYGKSGLAANIALFANVIFIMGVLAPSGSALTLAGIAGIILTIGTAVDANILIFERIREEQRAGMDTLKAIEIGFKKALPSIIDANMTHLLVAFILKYFGTGEIESFATTLIIGIFTSVFSAIFISRLVITYWMDKNKGVTFDTKFSKGLFQNFHFDWIGARKYFYIFSISVTVIGIVSLFTRGMKESVEFTGGRTYKVEFNKKANIEKIRTALEKTFIENGEVSSVDLKTISNDFNVEITTNYKLSDDKADSLVAQKLLSALKPLESDMGTAQIKESRTVSNSISSELWSASYISMSFALIAIFLYILFRFGYWQYSLGAIVGLIHDAFFVISVFSLLHGYLPFSLDVNQAFIAAILTVIGYSMNDTVIVFDRIRENLRSAGETDHHYEIINKSLNTTLSRTFNTSMILFMVVLIMFLFGGPSIKGFLFALLVGVIIGTYSSLCVATPILIDFSKRLKA